MFDAAISELAISELSDEGNPTLVPAPGRHTLRHTQLYDGTNR